MSLSGKEDFTITPADVTASSIYDYLSNEDFPDAVKKSVFKITNALIVNKAPNEATMLHSSITE